MKQVTIENVKKRIARIENAESVMLPSGMGLSMQHEFELACLRQLVAVTDQLHAVVAENAVLKEECGGNGSYRDCPACTYSQYIEAPETPATDAAIAELRAEGVEMFVAEHVGSPYEDRDGESYNDGFNRAIAVTRKKAKEFSAQLRSQSAPSPEAAAIGRQFEQVKGVQS